MKTDKTVLEEITLVLDNIQELNMSNYSEDQVEAINNAFNEVNYILSQPTTLEQSGEVEIDDQKKRGIYKGYTKTQLINIIISYQNHINTPVEKMSAEEWLLKNEDPSLSRLKKSSFYYNKLIELMEKYNQ